ncbi:MAG: T9SS type A sorting domain-containing protein [Aequorivita antarctica]
MKKILLLLLLVSGFASAQIVNIPDANFKAELIADGVDTNMDGEIQISEALAVSTLNLNDANISNTEGLQSFTNLIDLIITNNPITSINLSGNINLETLNCNNNDLLSLDLSSNPNLITVFAITNHLSFIDVSNNPAIETLWVGDNSEMSSLDVSSCSSLVELRCSGNAITSLDLTNNPLLEVLWCELNQISSLDITNNSNLTFLECGFNNLIDLDITNNILLEDLRCYNNLLVTLDCSFNTNLTSLYITNNLNLESVFIKNGSDESSNMGSGSWLENWLTSNNPSLQYVCADEFQITEIQQFAGTDYPVNSFCTFPPGGDVNTITGVTKFDDEGDGCDSGDSNIPYTSFNIEFNGTPTNAIAYSNAQGVYNVYAGQAGLYTLLPNLENPSYFNINPPSADILFPVIDNSIVTQDFCAEANGVHPDLEVVIATAVHARPGFEATYLLVYKNKGNQTLSGNVQFNYPEDQMDFVSSSTTPDTQGAGAMTFNFTDLQPYQTETVEIVLDVNGPADIPPVNIGDVLELNAEINPVAGDEMPNDNVFILNQTVIGSFDPNNIVCLQGEEVPTNYIGDFLHYVINFENTGSAPAENVVVTMQIDPIDFDPTSLQILNISHDVQIIIYNNLAEFYFQNINLDTGGHGNILLKMKTNSELRSSDNVEAKANIYFDYNFPVETNEAITSFRVLGVDEYNSLKIVLFPNPANDLISIQSASVINNISIYDLQGRLIDTRTTNKQHTELNISALKTGVYFLSIETETGTAFKKIIKY